MSDLWSQGRSPTPAPVSLAEALSAGIALCLGAGAFLVIQAFGAHPYVADEGLYYYGAVQMARGSMPYRDFFFAHPPLHLLPTALVLAFVDGFGLTAARLVHLTAALLQAVGSFFIVRQLLLAQTRVVRVVAPVLSAALLLFCEGFLSTSANDTGLCQAGAWLVIGLYLLARAQPAAAGVAAGLAVTTALQAAPLLAMLALVAFCASRRSGLRFLLGLGAAVTAVHVVGLLVADRAFLEQVYGYHLAKVARPGRGAALARAVLVDNWTLFALAAVSAAFLLRQRDELRGWGLALTAGTVVYFAAVLTRPRAFSYYFHLSFFPAAILVGVGLGRWLELIRAGRSAHHRSVWLWALAALLPATVLAGPLRAAVGPARYWERQQGPQSYRWTGTPALPETLNRLVRRLFWQGGIHRGDTDPNPVTWHLWRLSRWLDTYPAIVARVRTIFEQRPETTLLGSSSVAPLVALGAGISLTGGMADTNLQRLEAGVLSLAEVTRTLERAANPLLLLQKTRGLGSHPGFQTYVAGHFQLLETFESASGEKHFLWSRKEAPTSRRP